MFVRGGPRPHVDTRRRIHVRRSPPCYEGAMLFLGGFGGGLVGQEGIVFREGCSHREIIRFVFRSERTREKVSLCIYCQVLATRHYCDWFLIERAHGRHGAAAMGRNVFTSLVHKNREYIFVNDGFDRTTMSFFQHTTWSTYYVSVWHEVCFLQRINET